jgi:hypothetical protein
MAEIIVLSKIFQPVRNYLSQILPDSVYHLLECIQCTGFWCGVVCGAILLTYNPFFLLACGCAASHLAVLSDVVRNYIESQTTFELPMESDNVEERE